MLGSVLRVDGNGGGVIGADAIDPGLYDAIANRFGSIQGQRSHGPRVPRSGQPVCEAIETILLSIPRVNCPDVMAVLAG